MLIAVPPLAVYVAIEGDIQGPFAPAELSQLWRAGDLDASALYWHRGLASWLPVASFAVPQGGVKIDAARVRLTTTHTIAGREIDEELDVISSEYVFAQDLLDDILVGVRDLVGGRSRTLQNALREGKRVCMSDLREEASRIGADAVVGVQLAYAPVRAGLSMLVVTGTAVGLGPPRLR